MAHIAAAGQVVGAEGAGESPSRPAARGRAAEAAKIRRTCLGQSDAAAATATAAGAEAAAAKQPPAARYRELFAPGQATKTWFGVIFSSAQVLPYFAIYPFMPQVLATLQISGADTQNLVLNLALLLGGVIGLSCR
ncbi:hypothetical protein [Streptomyces antimycoticus]|uniref:hypothetical protein n=1 Tax=Streptomyces antimycoticus TaxID=68175 RepID=UPI0025705EA5|nr:hypothetical protein [Streptomyces antimycoticus]WJD94974.1 hypothetical protein QR300_02615 [Streptomyces antimycoticus]